MKAAATIRARVLRIIKYFHEYSPRFRRKMQLNLIWATLSILLLVLVFEGVLYGTVGRNVSQDRIRQLQQQIETPFTLLVEHMMETSLEGIRKMGEDGMFDLTDIGALNKHMLFALGRVPLQGAALQIADENGTELLMYENGMASQTRLTRADGYVEWARWEGVELVGEVRKEPLEYDPRIQDWYTSAREQEIFWIIPSSMPGKNTFTACISASRRWKSSGKSYVGAVHLPLKGVMRLLLLFSRNDEGTIFGPFDSGESIAMMSFGPQTAVQVVQLRAVPPTTDEVAENADTNETAESDAQTAITAFMQQQWQHRVNSVEELVGNVRVNNAQWWVGTKQMRLGAQSFWLGIAVPEKSLSPAIQRKRNSMASVFISTVALALIILGLQLRFFLKASKEIEAEYAHLQEKKQGILQVIERGESSRLEFKSTIRWNLNTNKAGKEIEIAWLKTVVAYLNSEGGTILLGVRDDGEVLGLEADNFQNEDRLLLHVNNLIKQHVGLEFVQFIGVTLHHVEERQVLSVQCTPAKAPVFLKHNKDEQFYIRTGPSTLRLSGSEMLKYLTQQDGK